MPAMQLAWEVWAEQAPRIFEVSFKMSILSLIPCPGAGADTDAEQQKLATQLDGEAETADAGSGGRKLASRDAEGGQRGVADAGGLNAAGRRESKLVGGSVAEV